MYYDEGGGATRKLSAYGAHVETLSILPTTTPLPPLKPLVLPRTLLGADGQRNPICQSRVRTPTEKNQRVFWQWGVGISVRYLSWAWKGGLHTEMEYAWGLAASKTPFPGEFAATRSKPSPEATRTRATASSSKRYRFPNHSEVVSSSSRRKTQAGTPESRSLSHTIIPRSSLQPAALTQRPATNTDTTDSDNIARSNTQAQAQVQARIQQHARQKPASASAATFKDKQLPSLLKGATVGEASAVVQDDNHESGLSLNSGTSSSLSTTAYQPGPDRVSPHHDHSVGPTATAPLPSGLQSAHPRPPSSTLSSTAVCAASEKSPAPLSLPQTYTTTTAQQHHPQTLPFYAGTSLDLCHNNKHTRNRPRLLWTSAAATLSNTPDRGRDRRHHHATMVGSDSTPFSRSESATASHTSITRAVMTSEHPPKEGDSSSTQLQSSHQKKPFITRCNGRSYLSDPTLPYPLPVDLHELHRQSLRSLLLFQLFGGPVCSPSFANKPPTRVLDVGCGYGFWSLMCHSYYSRKGHTNIHFTGIDIAPMGGIAGTPPTHGLSPAPKDRTSTSAELPPDKNMRWDFVQHDLRNKSLPFPDEEFDLIMAKDLSLAIPTYHFQFLIEEYIRILKPGGTLEVWECDHPIRMLRPHVPDAPLATTSCSTPSVSHEGCSSMASRSEKTASEGNLSSTTGGASSSAAAKKSDHEKEVAELGAYVISNNTPLSGPQNNYLIEYNGWMNKYLEMHKLLAFPCANLGAILIQEPLLTNNGSKRLAIPLSEVRWEREGVGGVVTKDGKSYIDTSKAIGKAAATKRGNESADPDKKVKSLSAGQLALRQTALQTVVQFIEGVEPALREVSGKKKDEWDVWMDKLMKELMEKDGTNCGECLEVGAWWARKVQNPPS